MTDYAELLATKSAELAELTKALNAKDWDAAEEMALKIGRDFYQLSCIALTKSYEKAHGK